MFSESPLRYFATLCEEYKQKNETVPTIIFDVEKNTEHGVIDVVFQIAYKLSASEKVAQCIIVLNDATVAYSHVRGISFNNVNNSHLFRSR